jgi:TetR/AcrR family transcriptional regulator, transcriptional repressor for nem operon
MMSIMPWSKEHKRETRERIVQAAADAFRERGIDGVAVADVMNRAGLTHGGFYAHFKSKDDLVKAAFEQMSREVADTVGATAYLADLHMLHPERGCPLPTVGTELVRSGAKMRRSVAAEVRARIARVAERLGKRRNKEADAAGAFACMVGGMIIARAFPENEGSAYLESCRAFLRRAIGEGIL